MVGQILTMSKAEASINRYIGLQGFHEILFGPTHPRANRKQQILFGISKPANLHQQACWFVEISLLQTNSHCIGLSIIELGANGPQITGGKALGVPIEFILLTCDDKGIV